MKKVVGTCLVSSMLLMACSDSDKQDVQAVSAPPQATQQAVPAQQVQQASQTQQGTSAQPQGMLPTQATRQNQAADVKQLNSAQMQQIQTMETQVRGMLNQVQSSQQTGGQLSQQQLIQMQQQVQQMMNQLQTGEVPAQAPAAPTQQTTPSSKPEAKPAAKPETPPERHPEPHSKQQSSNIQYSKKYTFRGQPLTLEQERKWEAYLKQQVMLEQARARNRALNEASRAVQQAGARISRQIDYNSMRNACHIANNCRVVRER